MSGRPDGIEIRRTLSGTEVSVPSRGNLLLRSVDKMLSGIGPFALSALALLVGPLLWLPLIKQLGGSLPNSEDLRFFLLLFSTMGMLGFSLLGVLLPGLIRGRLDRILARQVPGHMAINTHDVVLTDGQRISLSMVSRVQREPDPVLVLNRAPWRIPIAPHSRRDVRRWLADQIARAVRQTQTGEATEVPQALQSLMRHCRAR